MAKKDFGNNMSYEFKGNKLIIELDYTKTFGRTKKGEGPNVVIASTGGNATLYGPKNEMVKIGVNVYRPAKEDE